MKGLIFSEPMVRAWLAGNKTVTRRLIKPQPPIRGIEACHYSRTGWAETGDYGCSCIPFPCPYRPGETVYIKETWQKFDHPYGDVPPALYKADDEAGHISGGWKSPRFMPEWASRSKALIKSVRPERIQDITEEDARREGLQEWYPPPGKVMRPATSNVIRFNNLWDSLHPGSWERNDWAWRIELEKL